MVMLDSILNKASKPKDTHVSKRTSSNDVAGRVPTGTPTRSLTMPADIASND